MIARGASQALSFFRSFSPRRAPLMTRQSYSREMTTAWSYTVAQSLIEGEFIAVLALKVEAFNATGLQVAIITAAPLFANVLSMMWAFVSRGRRKVPFTTALLLCIVLIVAAVGALGARAIGTWGLVGLFVLARCLLTGVITLRSTIWRHNYPRHLRAQLTSRLSIVAGLTMVAVTLFCSALLDWNVGSYRVFFPLAAMVGLIGVVSFWRVRLRGQRALLDYENQPSAKPQRRGEGAGIWEYDDQVPSTGFWGVLRRDGFFREYMLWMFLGGVGNMMLMPVIVLFVAESTRGMAQAFLISNTLIKALSFGTAMATVALWARYMDRVHVTTSRYWQSWLWSAAYTLMFLGALWSGTLLVGGLLVFALGRVVMGVGQGGGMLAWQLGHNDFASRQMVAVYMGIHVTLTGVRGLTAPFIGILLYSGWPSLDLPIIGVLPGFEGMGSYVFLIAAAMSLAANRGFTRLSRRLADVGRLTSRDG